MNKISTEKAIEVLYTVRAYYANLTLWTPKGEDCKGIEDVTCSEIANSCLMAIKVLEQESADDTISRKAAINAFERFIHELGIEDAPYNYGEMALSVKNVPPITPQPKTGHWIDTGSGQKCSRCGEIQYGYDNFRRFCANCGHRMVIEPQEREGK